MAQSTVFNTTNLAGARTKHHVSGRSILPPFEPDLSIVAFGMGCFWGAERVFWQLPGVSLTAVGYGGGQSDTPNYKSVCSGETFHAELVLVQYDSTKISFETLLKTFWEKHDPTQGMRQGNDIGSQYRSAILVSSASQRDLAESSKLSYQQHLIERGFGPVTTEIADLEAFYYAEEGHQQYLSKNPNGYCGLGGTGISCAI